MFIKNQINQQVLLFHQNQILELHMVFHKQMNANGLDIFECIQQDKLMIYDIILDNKLREVA